MRKHVIAAVAVAAAVLLPGTALADWAGPAVPAGSLWQVGSAPACRTVATPPAAPAGEAPILVGAPGRGDQWCHGYARLGAGGALRLPGGIPGERLTPAQYARETGQAVTVAYTATGAVVVYLS